MYIVKRIRASKKVDATNKSDISNPDDILLLPKKEKKNLFANISLTIQNKLNISSARMAKFSNTSENLFKNYKKKTIDLLNHYKIMDNRILGIDITPHCIYVCEIDSLKGKRVLTSLTSVCMEGKFVTEDIIGNPEDYADSLKALVKENNIKTKNVALSIPVCSSIVKTLTLPKMDDNEIKKALKFGSLWSQFMQQNNKPEDYSIFYQVTRRESKSESMDLVFVATKLSDIKLYTDIVKNSGLNPVIVDVRCFAISNAFNYVQKRGLNNNSPHVFLEFGTEDNYIIILNNDHVNVFEMNMTDRHRTLLLEKNTPNEEEINEFIEIYTKQISDTLSSYEVKNSAEKINEIFVLSSVPLLKTMIDKFSNSLKSYAISECNFFDYMEIPDDLTISKNSARENISSWVSCISNAVRKLTHTAKNSGFGPDINILKHIRIKETRERQQKYVVNGAFAIASIAILYFMVLSQQSISGINRELSEKLAEIDKETVEQQYAENTSNYKDLTDTIDNMEYLSKLENNIHSNQNKLVAINEYLNLVILDNVWLKELKFTAPDKLEISGGSTSDQSIVEFLDLLNQGSQFSKVSLRGINEVREVSWYDGQATNFKSFQLDGTISETLPEDPMKVNIIAGESNHGT